MHSPGLRIIRGLRYGCLTVLLLSTWGCADGAKKEGSEQKGDTENPEVVSWHEEDYPYRVQVTLSPHSTTNRLDVPVIFRLQHPGTKIQRDVKVYEKTGVDEYSPVNSSGAWSQPDGTVFEVGFTAKGVTEAGMSRDFLVYYKTADESDIWSPSQHWSEFFADDADGDSIPESFTLAGGDYSISRTLTKDGVLENGLGDNEDTSIELNSNDWTFVRGFTNSDKLETDDDSFDTLDFEEGAVSRILSDEDPFSSSVGIVWSGRETPLPHDAHLAYRVFEEFPFMEFVMSESLGDEYRMSSAEWNARELFLSDTYDRMVSDTRGDEAYGPIWDTTMQWLVIYNSNTGKAFGWYEHNQGVIRADTSVSGPIIFDSYGYSSGVSTAFRYLWAAGSSKDEIVTLFDAMKPGVKIGAPENRDLNIIEPRGDSFFFPDDEFMVTVSTPNSNKTPVTVSIRLSDGTEMPMEMGRISDALLLKSPSPLVLDESYPEGLWTVAVNADGKEATVDIEFRLPNHPKLLFGPEDLSTLRSRKDDAAFADIWNAMLEDGSRYEDPLEVPDGVDIRSYADTLINLALIQLVDPAEPYDDMLWKYFFTMLRYPEWEQGENSFNNLDLTVGHFLTALALTYDWHYDDLTASERAELRERLRSVTSQWVFTGYLTTFRDIDWHNFGAVTNNHYWINHEGVAASAFVLADEMPDDVRLPWVNRTEENLGIILSVLEDDGSSNEGVAYHSYGQINLFQWIDMRDRALGGRTAGSSPWFEESVLFDLYSLLPGGDDNYGGVANFGDCPPYHYQPPRTIQSWLATRLDNSVAEWNAQNMDLMDTTAASFLWYKPDVPVTEPSTLPPWRLFPDKGIFTWRSSWDNDAIYFSLKCGSYFGGHEHPDAGNFILHRAGVPYITDHGYSYLKKTDEHNLIVFDDTDQYGGNEQWMPAADPVNWAKIDSVIADAAYFDLVADPRSMVQLEDLDSWKREIVALSPDIYLVRDKIASQSSHDMAWLMHSYTSIPPDSNHETYTYTDQRMENPWIEEGQGSFSLKPQEAAPILHVADFSDDDWTASIEPSFYVPELNPDTGEYNESQESFQVGTMLKRGITGASVSSSVAMWFGDDLSMEYWTDDTAEAARFHRSDTDVAVVIWPQGPSVSGFHDFDVTGEMGGRRFDEPSYFGRKLTSLAEGGTTLMDASSPSDVFARLEHEFSTADPGVVVTNTSSETTLMFYCPNEPFELTIDGASNAVSWANGVLTVELPAGEHRVEMW